MNKGNYLRAIVAEGADCVKLIPVKEIKYIIGEFSYDGGVESLSYYVHGADDVPHKVSAEELERVVGEDTMVAFINTIDMVDGEDEDFVVDQEPEYAELDEEDTEVELTPEQQVKLLERELARTYKELTEHGILSR